MRIKIHEKRIENNSCSVTLVAEVETEHDDSIEAVTATVSLLIQKLGGER